jgi:hypothetical protein
MKAGNLPYVIYQLRDSGEASFLCNHTPHDGQVHL